MPVIVTKKLKKVYGSKKQTKFTALSDVDLSIERGESVAILGKAVLARVP